MNNAIHGIGQMQGAREANAKKQENQIYDARLAKKEKLDMKQRDSMSKIRIFTYMMPAGEKTEVWPSAGRPHTFDHSGV